MPGSFPSSDQNPNVKSLRVTIASTNHYRISFIKNFVYYQSPFVKSPKFSLSHNSKLVFTTCHLLTYHRNNIFCFVHTSLLFLFFLFPLFTPISLLTQNTAVFRINSYEKYTGFYQRFPILFYHYLTSIERDSSNFERQIKPKHFS